MSSFWLNIPSKLDPIIFNIPFIDFGVRWYSVGYILAFLLCYILVIHRIKNEKCCSQFSKKMVEDSFFYIMLAIIIGARTGYFLFYEPMTIFSDPLSVFLPFGFKGGFHITGFSGMSYHGGVIGVIVAYYYLSKRYKVGFLSLMDLFIPAIPLGYTFGRLGNFMNGELYGRVTSSVQGMIFPISSGIPLKSPVATKVLNALGWKIQNMSVVNANGASVGDILKFHKGELWINLPRFPSQLYEAFFEGIVLFLILWFIRKYDFTKDRLWTIYLFGYGLFRFLIEYLRWPDQGYFFSVFTKGQLFCLFMMLVGSFMYIYISKKQAKQTV